MDSNTKYPDGGYRRSSRVGGRQPVHEPEVRRAALKRAGLLPSPVHEPEVTRAKQGLKSIPSLNNAKSILKLGLGTALRYANLGANLYDLYESYENPSQSQPYYMAGGWTPRFPVPCRGVTYDSQHWNGSAFNGCTGLQAGVGPPGLAVNEPVTPAFIDFREFQSCPPSLGAATTYAACQLFDPTGNSDRFFVMWSLNRVGTGYRPLPHASMGAYYTAPELIPWNPMELPIYQWTPLLKPLPVPAARLAAASRSKFDPSPQEAPGYGPPVRPPVRPDYQSPVPKGGKERKFILAPSQGSPIGILMNAATETNDFVTAIYKALPRKFRPYRRTTLQEKANLVFLHFQHVDMGLALKNLLQNQIGDTIGGIQGRLNAKANRAGNRATGLRRIKL